MQHALDTRVGRKLRVFALMNIFRATTCNKKSVTMVDTINWVGQKYWQQNIYLSVVVLPPHFQLGPTRLKRFLIRRQYRSDPIRLRSGWEAPRIRLKSTVEIKTCNHCGAKQPSTFVCFWVGSDLIGIFRCSANPGCVWSSSLIGMDQPWLWVAWYLFILSNSLVYSYLLFYFL